MIVPARPNTLQHSATRGSSLSPFEEDVEEISPLRDSTLCNALQRSATLCTTPESSLSSLEEHMEEFFPVWHRNSGVHVCESWLVGKSRFEPMKVNIRSLSLSGCLCVWVSLH